MLKQANLTWLGKNRVDAWQQVHLTEYFKDFKVFNIIIILPLFLNKLIFFVVECDAR